MLRRFSRINSVPHYRVEQNKQTGKFEVITISSADHDNTSSTSSSSICSKIHPEYQYLNLIHDILTEKQEHLGRNGSTFSVFGAGMVFSLEQGSIPILTTKKMAWKTCLKELLWFIQGNTDNRALNDVGVHIWDDNASREFMESRGLAHYAEADLGPIYGYQWRHFNAEYKGHTADYTGKGIDQLSEIIRCLKHPTERFSRRLIMTAWNPCQIDEMALPPCHILCQFNVDSMNRLSCALYQRSGDVGLGVPFNIASYSFLTHLLAKHCGLVPHEFVYYLGNAHIYDDHADVLITQLMRQPFDFPRVEITVLRDDINDYSFDDFRVLNYQSYDALKMVMRK
jgi:thymidylate synthase